MSTVDRIEHFLHGKTSLSLAALSSFIPYLITETFYTERIPRFLSIFTEIPQRPLIYLMWDATLYGEIPTYVMELTTAVIPFLAFVMSIIKFLGSDQIVEDLSLGDGIIRFHHTDAWVIGLWLLSMVPVALLVGYPLGAVPILHGIITLGLQVAISLLPSVFISLLALPYSTRSPFLKTIILLGGFIAGAVVIFLALFMVRLTTCWLQYGGCTLF